MLHVPRKPPSYVRLTVPGFISRALHVGLFHFVTECLILSNRTTDLQQASQTQKCILFFCLMVVLMVELRVEVVPLGQEGHRIHNSLQLN